MSGTPSWIGLDVLNFNPTPVEYVLVAYNPAVNRCAGVRSVIRKQIFGALTLQDTLDRNAV